MLGEVSKKFDECQAARRPVLAMVQEYETHHAGNKEGLISDHAKVIEAAFGEDEVLASERASALFKPRGALSGVHSGFPVSIFCFKDESMWRKTPANPIVLKLAKSIISTGFRATSVIESRTLNIDGDQVSFTLLLGDGSARAVAAAWVWMLLAEHVSQIPCRTEPVSSMIASLLDLRVNFEVHGDGSAQQALVVQAVRQAQAAAVLPCNTLHWVGMAIMFTGQNIGTHVRSTSTLERTLDTMVRAYNARPEVTAYEETAAPARKRRRSGKNNTIVQEDADRDAGLCIGKRRLTAMRNLLSGSTVGRRWSGDEHSQCVGVGMGSG